MKEQILDFDLLIHAPWTTVNRHHNLYRHPSLDMPINVHQDNLMLAPLNLARGTLIQKMIGFGQIMMRFFYDIFAYFLKILSIKWLSFHLKTLLFSLYQNISKSHHLKTKSTTFSD